jgi:RNA polymerase sigma-70 factor (ECF subfamily)
MKEAAALQRTASPARLAHLTRPAINGLAPQEDGGGAPSARLDPTGLAAIRRAQGGDLAALDGILRAVRPRVVAVAKRMVRDADEAEDVSQESLTKVWRNLGRYEARSAFSTWLHRIVVNTALDHLRARRAGVVQGASPGTGGDAPTEADRGPRERVDPITPEDRLAEAELRRVVQSAMDALSPVHRAVLAWRELEGASYRDIAVRARCPVGTVMSRLHHARHRLAATLRHDAAHDAAHAAEIEGWLPVAA